MSPRTQRTRLLLAPATAVKLAAPLIAICIGLPQHADAQKLQQRMADRYNDQFDYSKVAAIYEDLDAKGKADAATLRALAGAYTKLDNAPAAEGAYRRLMIAPGRTTDDVRAFGDALRASGKYNEALEQYQIYAKERPDDPRVKGYMRSPDLFFRLRRDSLSATIRKLPINSPQADLGMSVMGEYLLFSSARGEGTGGARDYAWDHQPFLNLFSAELKGETVENPLVMRQHINSRWHDGTVSFDSLAKRVYFTRNNVWYSTVQKSTSGNLNLGIYFSDVVKGEFGQEEWGNIIPFDHNDPEFNLGHPNVSPDGRKLYFASDRPGGEGGIDIWVCQNLGNQWGAPENLGPRVNTPGDEMHPYCAANGTLYFASNGHPGLGGLDLFFTRIGANGPGNVFNMGYPMNTRAHDHGLILINDTTGFFASARGGGQGSDDIYGCTIRPQIIRMAGRVIDKATKEPVTSANVVAKGANGMAVRNALVEMKPDGHFIVDVPYQEAYLLVGNATGYKQAEKPVATNDDDLENIVIEMEKYDYLAQGTVFDGETGQPQAGATVLLTDANGQEVARHTTDASGNYSFPLEKEREYRLQADKEGRLKQSARVNTRTATSPIIRNDFHLFPLKVDQVVRLDNIFYDYSKWDIRPDAALELDKLVQTLTDNPTVAIELSSHTDCRGKDAFNRSLSQKRAKSAVNYLISKGIVQARLKSKGYGESKPSEACACEKCSEEEHQRNRRTEFKVLSK